MPYDAIDNITSMRKRDLVLEKKKKKKSSSQDKVRVTPGVNLARDRQLA